MSSLDRLRSYSPVEIAAVTFGLTALLAVLVPLVAVVAGDLVPVVTLLVPVVAVVGWFLLTPWAALQGWGDDERDEATARAEGEDPIERLRERYADGEIDEVEFERQLETLLKTENADPETAHDAVGARRREREVE